MRNSYCIKKKRRAKIGRDFPVIPTKMGIQIYLQIASLDSRFRGNDREGLDSSLHWNDEKKLTETGQSFTEFIIIFPVLLLMLCSVLFFARMLVLKQRSVMAVRYIAWYAGRNSGDEPPDNTINALFFNKGSNIAITHPEARVGFAGNSLGDLGSMLGSVAGINGTALRVQGDHYPFSRQKSSISTQHFVFMDTWKDSCITGKALKYELWAIAVGKAFQGSRTNMDLENPSIVGN